MIGFQVTVENVGDVFFETQCIMFFVLFVIVVLCIIVTCIYQLW